MSPLAIRLACVIGLLVALGGFGGWAYMHGRTDEKAGNIERTLKETDNARKGRETIERTERDRSDDAATKCLRNPNGC